MIDGFLAEARIAAGLDHPHIVPVYDAQNTDEEGFYVVSKVVEGTTLKARLSQRRFTTYDEIVSILSPVADALHVAHRSGLVHRDVKPANILLDSTGRPMLTDFGLAIPESRQRSHIGELSGTPAYMSPEQVRGESQFLDGRTDIWSLGVILYEMLTGRRPFRGETSRELFEEIMNREPKPPRMIEDGIPVELENVCLRALRKQISDRYTSARDFANELRDAVAPYRTYKPSPIDTRTIAIPAGLSDLIENVARNVHENWAHQRVKEGWTRGPERNDSRMEHPCLVPFEQLPASEKEYDRIVAAETIKVILTLGYRIVGHNSNQAMSRDTSHGPNTESS